MSAVGGAITLDGVFGWKSLGCPILLDGVDARTSKLGKWEAVVYLLGN